MQQQEGPVVNAHLTDPGEQTVQIGMSVEIVTCKIRTDMDYRGIIIIIG